MSVRKTGTLRFRHRVLGSIPSTTDLLKSTRLDPGTRWGPQRPVSSSLLRRARKHLALLAYCCSSGTPGLAWAPLTLHTQKRKEQVWKPLFNSKTPGGHRANKEVWSGLAGVSILIFQTNKTDQFWQGWPKEAAYKMQNGIIEMKEPRTECCHGDLQHLQALLPINRSRKVTTTKKC